MAELEIKPSAAARIRVLTVLLIGIGVALTLVFLLTGGGGDALSPKTTISTFVPDATGLLTDSDVRLSGIPIGAVKKVELSGLLDPQRAVRVDMQVKTGFLKNIPADSQTSIRADTLIGDTFVSIDEGKSPIPMAEYGVLRSEPLKQAAESADLMLALQDELRQVDDLLVQISSGNTVIGRFVMGEEEYDQVLDRVTAFDREVHNLVGRNSAVGEALFSDVLYNQIRNSLLRVDNALAAIQRGEGMGGRFFATDEQYNQILHQLHDLRALLANPDPALLRDEAVYIKVRRMLAATDAMISALNAGQGGMGQLLHNPRLYESLNGSLRNMQELLKDFREHPQKYLRYKVF